MPKLCKAEDCTGCSACANICPNHCISMLPDPEGFLRPVIDELSCVDCELCQQVCPLLNASPLLPDGETIAFAAINKDEQIRYDSTSGGVFSLLCQQVLGQGGVVFGAAYDESFNVTHTLVDTQEGLSKLRGAKYAQSDLGHTFCRVREILEQDKYVLFSGTPCQVGGLVSFLGKDYEKLILVDLICHGVPSPQVWQKYIAYRSTADACGTQPEGINLRSKETGWPGYSIRFAYPNAVYSAKNVDDPYLRGFVGNLFLRPSCYQCHFKGSRRQSDFTLGDYWGIWDQQPDYHDGKGTSLVLLHSPKAMAYWRRISSSIRFTSVDVQESLSGNSSAIESSLCPAAREAFLARYDNEDFSSLIDELLPKHTPVPSPLARAKSVLRKVKARIVPHGKI